MSPSGQVTILYSFGAFASDGIQPEAPLVEGTDGNFYGTTVNGGANICTVVFEGIERCGTIFRMTPAGGVTIVHSFGRTASEAIAPQGPLIQGKDGNFYGTTASGGGGRCGGYFGCGTVYRMTPTGVVTILHAFSVNSRTDGYGPSPYLLQAADGNFYGTTGSGGDVGGGNDLFGTIFRLTPTGVKTTLYSFGPSEEPTNPVGGLIEASDGMLYGLTAYGKYFVRDGQTYSASGTVFRFSR